jgi:hypothetical protein
VTLVKRSAYYHFDFWYKDQRYQGTTEQTDRDDAAYVEEDLKRKLRRQARGVPTLDPKDSPLFSTFAGVFLKQQREKLTRPDVLERTLRMVLAFWGKKPKSKAVKGGVYHNLRLLDPILKPAWLDRFDTWMDTRQLAGSTRNSYRSALSGIYTLAQRPRYRLQTGVERNPFADVERHRTRARGITATVEDVKAWMAHAPPHLVIALSIGALAPKLRLQQVLGLRFDRHLDRGLTQIRYQSHKTRRHTHADQVTPVSADLRRILLAIRNAHPESPYAVTFRNKPIRSIRTAAKRAAKEAGLIYGMADGAITFHALRSVAVTECARGGIAELLASRMVGHLDVRTTRKHYTHLLPADELATVEQLAGLLGLTDTAIAAVGTSVGTARRNRSRARVTHGHRDDRVLKRKSRATH